MASNEHILQIRKPRLTELKSKLYTTSFSLNAEPFWVQSLLELLHLLPLAHKDPLLWYYRPVLNLNIQQEGLQLDLAEAIHYFPRVTAELSQQMIDTHLQSKDFLSGFTLWQEVRDSAGADRLPRCCLQEGGSQWCVWSWSIAWEHLLVGGWPVKPSGSHA